MNLNRDGVVYARRQGTNGPEVQVYYADRDLLSDWLPVEQRGSAGAIFHFCPRIGDAVTVKNLGTGIEQGVVVSSHPTDNNPGITPNSLDSVALSTSDGAFFEHEPNSGTLTIADIGTLHLHVKGETLAFSGPWTLVSSGAVQITGTTVTVTAPTITLAGNVEITGSLKVDGYTTLAGGVSRNRICKFRMEPVVDSDPEKVVSNQCRSIRRPSISCTLLGPSSISLVPFCMRCPFRQ